MAAVDEIAIKLGINVGDFKAALADAGAGIKKFKKEGEGNFFGGIKTATKSLNDFRTLIGGSAIAAAVTGFFSTAIDAANASTDATDENAAAVRRFGKGVEEIKGVFATVAVATVGFFNRIGESIGNTINIQRAFRNGGIEGAKEAQRMQKIVEETGRAADEVERNLAAVRKKHGAEFLAITKELADIEKKAQDQKIKGLTVYETEANLEAKIAELRTKASKGEGEAIDRRRLALDIAKTQLALDEAHLAVRKDRAAEEKRAAEDEKKSFDEYAKAAAERRKDQSLSAEKEAELFTLRQKSAEAAATQGKADLNIITLQNQQILAQMEIVKLRAKLTASLSESEQAQLAQLEKESAELQKQIAQKQKLIAASGGRNPVEQKLLDYLQSQLVAVNGQIAGLTARAGITANFTDAEGKFLDQLQQQKTAIFEQIDLLEKRAKIPGGLTKDEEALLVPLKEQGRIYTLLIGQIKERAATGNVQTAKEVEYLDALKASTVALAEQLKQLIARNGTSVGLSDAEKKTLENYKAQAVALDEIIADLNQRKNSSVGLTDDEAKLLPYYEAQTAELKLQVVAMEERQNATGNLAGIEQAVLIQWQAQQKALLEQIETMRNRKNVTNEQRAADEARLKSLLEGTEATKQQIAALLKGGPVVAANLVATEAMTKADKDALAVGDLQTAQKRQKLALEEAGVALLKDKTNPLLVEQFLKAKDVLAVTETQLALRQKISLGQEQDLEAFRIMAKSAGERTELERETLKVYELQTKEKRLQIETNILYAAMMERELTPKEQARLTQLLKQTEEIGKQIKAKQTLVSTITDKVVPAEQAVADELRKQAEGYGRIITETERAALAATGTRLPAEARITSELERQLAIIEETAAREAQIEKSRRGTVTNTGDIGTLNLNTLEALFAKLSKDLTSLNAATPFGRDTVEEAILRAQLESVKVELGTRRDFQRAVEFWGSGKAEVRFGPSEFQRLNQLYSPDLAKQTAASTAKIAEGLTRLFPQQFLNIRPPPTP